MNLLGIAWRNIRQRPLTSALTAVSLALGVALVVATLVTGRIVQQSFESGAGLGYNMIVGAKGSPLQLVLNTVYLISKPIENVGWDFYEEFLPASRRADGIDGKYAASTGVAVPTCMGDYDFFAGVIGASVADSLGLKVGDPFAPTHGADDGKVHDPFHVVGILERTWTPIDRGVFVNMEGFYLQDGHAKPLPDGVEPEVATTVAADGQAPQGPAPLPASQREVTAILLETASLPGLPPELTAMGLRTAINEGRDAQAALPVAEIRQLLDLFVRPLELVLLMVTALVVLVSALGILISMVGSSLERSRDVAIMRALGARRGHVLATVLIEAVLLAVGGGLVGWVLGHAIVAAIGPWIAASAGVRAGFFSSAPEAEALLVPFLVLLAILAALLPALAAYRTDVSRGLQGPG